MKNKKGWIKIVEAFTMILLIAGIFLVFLNNDSSSDFSQEIYKKEQEILNGIRLDFSLREDIMSFSLSSLPINLENFPTNLKTGITSKIPNNLNCDSKICELNDDCVLSNSVDKSTYTQEMIITSTNSIYSPRKLKLFCWRK